VSLAVLRRQPVTVARTPHDAFVVERHVRGRGMTNHDSYQTYWYAPGLGTIIKYDFKIMSGTWAGTPPKPWTATKVERGHGAPVAAPPPPAPTGRAQTAAAPRPRPARALPATPAGRTEIDCARSGVSLAVSGTYKCEEFPIEEGTYRGSIGGLFRRVNFFGWTNDDVWINTQLHHVHGSRGSIVVEPDRIATSLQQFNDQTKRGTNWSAMQRHGSTSYMTFDDRSSQCVAFFRVGHATERGYHHAFSWVYLRAQGARSRAPAPDRCGARELLGALLALEYMPS
jgi:hypothetical protein